MLSHRLLLGPVFIALVVLLAWLDALVERVPMPAGVAGALGGGETLPPGLLAYAVLVLICALAAWELGGMLRHISPAVSRAGMVAASWLGLTAGSLEAWGAGQGAAAVIGAGALVAAIPLVAHARTQSTEGAAVHAAGVGLAFVYLGLLPAAFVVMRQDHPAGVLLAALLVVKATDIGAFTVGTTMGRRKLIPWLSPGKTWEGLAGGLATAALVGGVAAALWGRDLGYGVWLGVLGGLVVGGVGQAGDLAASLLKRGVGVKNSGGVPGFGGVLDLMDSLLLAIPAAVWILWFAT